MVNLSPDSQKTAKNAKTTKPISQVIVNAAKSENKIEKSVKKTTEALKTETKNKTASAETYSKNLKNATALKIEKRVTPLIVDDKKKIKTEAPKAQNTKVELKNDIPKIENNSRNSKSSKSMEKDSSKVEKPSFETKKLSENIPEANKNPSIDAKPIKTTVTISEPKTTYMKLTKSQFLAKNDSVGPIDTAELKPVKERNAPPMPFIAPLPAKAEPPAICPNKPKITLKMPVEAKQEPEVQFPLIFVFFMVFRYSFNF